MTGTLLILDFKKGKEMLSDVIVLFENIKKRTSMYIYPVNYDTVASMIIGYNLAMRGCLLDGFQEWITIKFGDKCQLVWDRIILLLTFPDNPGAHCSPIPDDRLAIDKLFDLLEEFLLIKQDRNRGTRWIYAQYEQWLKEIEMRQEE